MALIVNLWSKLESVYVDNEWARTGRSQQPERCVLLLLATTSEVTKNPTSVELQSLRVQVGRFDQGLYISRHPISTRQCIVKVEGRN